MLSVSFTPLPYTHLATNPAETKHPRQTHLPEPRRTTHPDAPHLSPIPTPFGTHNGTRTHTAGRLHSVRSSMRSHTHQERNRGCRGHWKGMPIRNQVLPGPWVWSWGDRGVGAGAVLHPPSAPPRSPAVPVRARFICTHELEGTAISERLSKIAPLRFLGWTRPPPYCGSQVWRSVSRGRL